MDNPEIMGTLGRKTQNKTKTQQRKQKRETRTQPITGANPGAPEWYAACHNVNLQKVL